MQSEHDWVNVMEDMPGGDMVYRTEADEAVATLTAERDKLKIRANRHGPPKEYWENVEKLLTLTADLAAANERAEKAEGDFQEQGNETLRMMSQLNELLAYTYQLQDQLAEIRGKLPKTADGVPVVPGMQVWFGFAPSHGSSVVSGFDTYRSQVDGSLILSTLYFDGGFTKICGESIFSTPEAAESASGKEGVQDG